MQLKRWDNREIIFELECSSWRELLEGAIKVKISLYRANLRSADLRDANLRDADLRDADLSYANLSYADLSYADLRDADLRYADLSYANLSYADLRSAIGNMREWHSMQLETYMIVFNKHILAIGCQQHNIKKWESFTDDEIKSMDGGALEWWQKWKDFIFQAIALCEKK